MKGPFFGLGTQYDTGVQPSVALNARGVAVEVHKSEWNAGLWYHVGRMDQGTVRWSVSTHYDSGVRPACALNGHNQVVEVHESEWNSGLWYRVGSVDGEQIRWGPGRSYDSGATPRVALNDAGVVVEVHKSQWNNGLWYHVGRLDGNMVHWSASQSYDSGRSPRVAINNAGIVVEVHQSEWNSGLWYHVGRVSGNSVKWGNSISFGSGETPCVALTDDGRVVVVYYKPGELTLVQRCGTIRGNQIDWEGDALAFDTGENPSVACAGNWVIQTHKSANFHTLWYSTALMTDRARWMENALDRIGGKSLKELALPASHDAGMYIGSFPATLGKTQDLSIYKQLAYGIRYFDLRPGWDGSDLYIYHTVRGPKLSEVLDDVARFMQEGHRELVILKLSHYVSFDDDVYQRMVRQIRDRLGRWLIVEKPPEKRLAEVPIGDFLTQKGAVLVVSDEGYPVRYPAPGIWVYRDWDSRSAGEGDLRVFDQYAETTSYDRMKNDQLRKFDEYNGYCKEFPNLPCDLFLLSWTLTPITFVWAFSQEANRHLGGVMADLAVPNRYGYRPNLLYVDYVEYARVTDVALWQNGLGGSGVVAAEAPDDVSDDSAS